MLQIWAFVYQRLIDFPECKLDYKTLTTINFFESVHKLTNVKIHLHYSHMTGRIYSYAHHFCKMKVRENQFQFSCIARKLTLQILHHKLIFFFYLGFLLCTFTIQRTAAEGGGYHFDLLHRHLDISWAITAECSPLHIASSLT